MITSWKHKGLKEFYQTGSKKKIQVKHAARLRLLLFQLANAVQPEDMNLPGNGFHKLKGNLLGYYAVKVSANWRLIFKFINNDAIDVDYTDYH